MANVFFTLKLTWPTITNDIRVSVYNILDTVTPIASVQQNTPHLDQQYDFPGLPRVNFIYKIFETEINGSTVISQLGQATFVPANDSIRQKEPVDIQIGVTQIEGDEPNVWPAAVDNVVMPGWIGWEIVGGRNGQYPMRKGFDYTWDADTGTLQLLQLGDQFQYTEWFHWEFELIIQESSGGIGSGGGGAGFSDILLVTTSITLTGGDIGKKILIAPAGNYLEITLPAIDGVQANKITYFEMGSTTAKCAKIKAATGDVIAWLNNFNLYICQSESFELYKRVITTGNYQWRTQNLDGNFRTVGEFTFSDLGEGNVISLDGSNKDYQQYARLYDWITRNTNAISYASWSGANIFTRMKFSLKDTASNNFRVPDLQTVPTYLRPEGAGGVKGDYIAGKLMQHQHLQTVGELPAPPFGQTIGAQTAMIGDYAGGVQNHHFDLTSRSASFNFATGTYDIIDGVENNPNSRVSRLYIKI